MFNKGMVYHYTGLEGLLGIINEKSLWASNILYLNDASEFEYSKKILLKKIGEMKDDPSQLDVKLGPTLGATFCECVTKTIDGILSPDLLSCYICSFSKERDLLSQWRGYCQNAIGVSIGFDLGALNKKSSDGGDTVTECIYNVRNQEALIDELFEKLDIGGPISMDINSVDRSNILKEKISPCVTQFVVDFVALAPTFKHPQFSQEKECRFISIQPDNKGDVKFRAGKKMLIPFVEYPLPVENNKLIIDEIIIGPTDEPSLAESSLKQLLATKGVTCHKISHSTIPYRVIAP